MRIPATPRTRFCSLGPDPNAPDEILDDDRSVNEAPPDPYGDGEPEQFVGRDWDRPEGATRSGHRCIVRTMLRNNESYSVELSLSVAALASDFACMMSSILPGSWWLLMSARNTESFGDGISRGRTSDSFNLWQIVETLVCQGGLAPCP